MIRSFRHQGIRAFYKNLELQRVNPHHVKRLTRILATLDRSRTPQGMNLPGFQLHQLSGDMRGHYAVSVSGSWRVTFRFEYGDVFDVDYIDYH